MTAKQSLDRRRDVRSEEEFKKQIKEASLRERKLLDHWIAEFPEKTIVVENYGVDNSGEFVEFSNNLPDYRLIIDGVSDLYEIKQNPYSHRNSFKTYDLQCYIKMNAKILLFYGISKEGDITKDSRWAIIEPEAMQRMLLLPTNAGDKAWGFKPIVIVWERMFNEYFTSNNFKNI